MTNHSPVARGGNIEPKVVSILIGLEKMKLCLLAKSSTKTRRFNAARQYVLSCFDALAIELDAKAAKRP